METINLNHLTVREGGIYLLGEARFSGFAIETFPDGKLQTQMSLMQGLEDGVARRWHSNGQLKSETSFRNGAKHGFHQEWRPDGVLAMQSTWDAGRQILKSEFDEQGMLIRQVQATLPDHPPPVMIGMTDSTNRYYAVTLDNLGRITQVQGYSSFGGTLFAQKQANFDDRGRVYQTLTYAVNISTGAVGNALIGNKWFDPSGNLLQSIAEGDGQAFTKQTYNGVNWVLSTYRGYNTSGTSYSQAGTVAGDIIVEQNDKTFDEAGNIVSLAISQRLNDAPATGSGSTGALTYGTQPKARVSYVANWFDGIDRNVANANYGAIASFSRPATPPASSATVLVTQSIYNDAGEAYQSIDPMGNITQSAFDDAVRTTQIVEAFGTISARTTQFLYTLDNLISQMIAKNPITGDQVTTWDYGTTLASSGVARNDLLASVAYPDSTGPTDVVAYAYNRLGEQRTIGDQRGAIRTLYRDLLGRLTNDCVTTVGSNTDSTVLQITRAYDIRGMVNLITSTDSAAQGAGTILNQVAFAFNDFRQLITDQQSHSGAVTSGTPSVQYAYDDGGSSSNEIRLNQLTYPNSRAISYNFASGMDAMLGRVTSISDTSATLAQYLYLGAGTVVRITYPQPGIWLDLWGGTSGVFAGIDQFGRIIDQRWQNNITGTPTDIDRYKYGYDQNSNRLYKNNVVGTAAVSSGLDEFYAYDPLNRLTDMQRGVLNATNTGITGTPSVEQDWTLDPMGNWSNFITKAAGATNLNQTRTANTVNEITNITESTGPTWVVPSYDAAGNTITMPQVVDPTLSFTAVYDAWNRMVSISAGVTPVGQYQYDGRGFRIVKLTYTSTTLSETRDFYFTADWQDIEEDVSGSMVDQYVWGIRYIDELICRDDPTNERLYATQDANFNLTQVADSSGSPLERYLYDPYGSRSIMNGSWATASSSAYAWDVGHQALRLDTESGLWLSRHRYLHSRLGAFLIQDELRFFNGSSLYEYCRSSPVRFVDPLGRDEISALDYYNSFLQQYGLSGSPEMTDTLSTGCIGVTCLNLGIHRDPRAQHGVLNFLAGHPDFSNCYTTVEAAIARQQEMQEKCLCNGKKNMFGTDSRPMLFSTHFWKLGRDKLRNPSIRVDANGHYTKLPNDFPNTEQNAIKAAGQNLPNFDFAWFDSATGMWLDANIGDETAQLTHIKIGRKTYDEWVNTGYDAEAFCVACEDWQFPNKAEPATTRPSSKPSQ